MNKKIPLLASARMEIAHVDALRSPYVGADSLSRTVFAACLCAARSRAVPLMRAR